MNGVMQIRNTMDVRTLDKHGLPTWKDRIHNSVTTEGLTDLLQKYFSSGVSSPTFYFGLIGSSGFTGVAASDTLSSHSGWVENTEYNNATRHIWDEGTASGASISSNSVTTFTASGPVTIRGVLVASDSQKGGVNGVLFCTALFSTERSLAAGESFQITNYTVNASG